jgi:hypothetical protein
MEASKIKEKGKLKQLYLVAPLLHEGIKSTSLHVSRTDEP